MSLRHKLCVNIGKVTQSTMRIMIYVQGISREKISIIFVNVKQERSLRIGAHLKDMLCIYSLLYSISMPKNVVLLSSKHRQQGLP